MQMAQTIEESYKWGYSFGEAGYQPAVTTNKTDEQRAYLAGYIDGLFERDFAPDTALDRPEPEEIPEF